jgi:hypothetical protein
MWAKASGNAFKVGGGKAIYYDSSLVMRVSRAGWVSEKQGDDETARAKVYGERHRITIRKTKISGQEDKVTICHFHTSNGVLVPEGFDRPRDVLEIAEKFGVVQGGKAGWLSWRRHRWQGRHLAVRKLHNAPDLVREMEIEVREKFEDNAPEEKADATE